MVEERNRNVIAFHRKIWQVLCVCVCVCVQNSLRDLPRILSGNL
jgi:hypothetical protein